MAIDREQIIELGRKAGFSKHEGIITGGVSDLERFAALVAAVEREVCAKVCDEADKDSDWPIAANCAAAIRARGETK